MIFMNSLWNLKKMHIERLIGHLFAVLLLRMCFGCNSVCGSMRWADAFETSKKHVGVGGSVQDPEQVITGFNGGGFSA